MEIVGTPAAAQRGVGEGDGRRKEDEAVFRIFIFHYSSFGQDAAAAAAPGGGDRQAADNGLLLLVPHPLPALLLHFRPNSHEPQEAKKGHHGSHRRNRAVLSSRAIIDQPAGDKLRSTSLASSNKGWRKQVDPSVDDWKTN